MLSQQGQQQPYPASWSLFADGAKKPLRPLLSHKRRWVRYRRHFLLRAPLALWAQSQAAVPHCCLVSPLPRCEWALAQGCPRRGRQGSVLPKFRPTQHFPLLFRCLLGLIIIFLINFVCLPLKEIWLHLLRILRRKAVNHWLFQCICVCWYSRMTYKQGFLKDLYLRQSRKTNFHYEKTHKIWKGLGKLCCEEAEMPAWFACRSQAFLGRLFGGK